ncbi:MAG TPA: hypothetical protein DCE44_18890 [Verrucomicrobiales bacterium]|nr:hypothetical protein [Verrucomicrobiales bacterium]
MSEAKHTPGPWTIDEVTDKYGITLMVNRIWESDPSEGTDEDGGTFHTDEVAEIVMDYADGIPLANARLIAAAPDLLAACEAWDTGFVDGEQIDAEQFRQWVNERRRMARAAIAKATGK